MKKLLIISFLLIVGLNGFGQNAIEFKELTKEKHEDLMHYKSAECEWMFNANMIYKSLSDINTRKLNQIKRWAKKYECSTVYLDFNAIKSSETYKKGVYSFYVICTKE